MHSAYIVIAAYNEDKKIQKVIEDLNREQYKNIIVVDDASRDNTSYKAKEKGAIVLRHSINRGQGAALKTGIDYALEMGAQYIVTFDADGQHKAKDIKQMITILEKGKYDIVLGSRFLKKTSNVPFIRKLFLKGGVLVNLLLSGIMLTDSQNGLRAMTRDAAKKIEIKQSRMAHASEILDEIKRKKLRYKEVPVTIEYTAYSVQKGQKTTNAFNILLKLVLKKIMK